MTRMMLSRAFNEYDRNVAEGYVGNHRKETKMGDIGTEKREYEFEPFPEQAPSEPAPAPAPTPAPVPEPEKEPAR